MRKRLKNNAEVAHYWANKIQSEGHGNNMYFVEDSIFSYGSHFEMARHVTNKKGEHAILETTRRYSVSTAKHQSLVGSASSHIKSFEVPVFEGPDQHKQNLQYWRDSISSNRERFKRARLNKKYISEDIFETAEQARKYIDFYGLGKKLWDEFWKLGELSENDIKAIELADKKQREWDANREKREELKRQRQAEKEKEDLELWLKGENSRYFYSSEVRLRISKDGKRVQTSRGAEVGIRQAKALLNAIKEGQKIAERKINGFEVISYDGQTLVIGCHDIPQSEIDRIAPMIENALVKA